MVRVSFHFYKFLLCTFISNFWGCIVSYTLFIIIYARVRAWGSQKMPHSCTFRHLWDTWLSSWKTESISPATTFYFLVAFVPRIFYNFQSPILLAYEQYFALMLPTTTVLNFKRYNLNLLWYFKIFCYILYLQLDTFHGKFPVLPYFHYTITVGILF